MKIKNIFALMLGFITYFTLHSLLFPYDNKKAHPAINETIVKFVEENSSNLLPENYEIKITTGTDKYKGYAVTNPGFLENTYGESEVEFTIFEWIKHGGYSADEPELAAAVRHFYDPIGLNNGCKYLTNRGTYWEWMYANPQIDAIEWALGDTEKGSDNKWSLEKGKEYFKSALELANENMKAQYLAKAFRCLGEVLHNTGDMGCPPHTRNDSHAAPLGYSGGAALGSPDPYEEMFMPTWPAIYFQSEPDPSLKAFFQNASTIRAIQEKLAQFTNQNFFTEQTINGTGAKFYDPVNMVGHYPSPLLQELEYNTSDYTFYKTFPSGHKVKMCKDKGYFSSRTYPYIDKKCVESQADELIPNILNAGANVIRLYMPKLELKITEAKVDGTLKGTVTHIPTDEYKSSIYYSGKINIYKSNSNKIGSVDCNTGDFSGSVSSLNPDDEIYAALEIADINIRSDNFKIVAASPLTIDPANLNATLNGQYVFRIGYEGTLPADYKCQWFVMDKPGQGVLTGDNTTELKYKFKTEGTFEITVSLVDKSESKIVASASTHVTVARGALSDLYAQDGFIFSLTAGCVYDDSTYSDYFSLNPEDFAWHGAQIEWSGTTFSVDYNYKWQGTIPIVGDTFYVSGKLSGVVSENGKTANSLYFERHLKHNRTDYKYDFTINLFNIPLETKSSFGSTTVTGYIKGEGLKDYITGISYKATILPYNSQEWKTITLKKLNYSSSVYTPELSISFQ